MSSFDFLNDKTEYSIIHSLCCEAEAESDAAEKAVKCRKALSALIDFIYDKKGVKIPESATMLELLDGKLIGTFVNNAVILESLHFIRKLGKNAEHSLHIKKTQANLAFDNLTFFAEFVYRKFEEPKTVPHIVIPKYMTEAETRRIYIDLYLSEVGWDVLSPTGKTTLPDGTVVDSGIVFPGKACCEIPVKGMPNKSKVGFCDYVLYGKDGKPLAIVEAKKTSVDASVGSQQVKLYGECMEAEYGYIPVLYYTNGYEIYVVDGTYPARKVMAFHTMEELEYMLQKRGRNDITDLTIDDSISGRPYQKMAITSICERFNEKQRRGLIVMATGTGKTRVSISLVDVLLRNKWIKNVLFLADRTSLVEQAFKNFKKILPKMSYCVLSDKKLADEPNARITFSTHQTMINYIDAKDKGFTSARYDLIIIDEAHRSIFNKFGSIFKYFDCLLVGLTATPKEEVDANTYELFNCESGEPNFAYSLEEAIKEKYLVPYKVESKTTKLLSQGIKYSDLSDDDKEKVEHIIDDVDSDFVIPKETLFKIFYNEGTCKRVLEDLMENGLRVDAGQKVGKTIIFAYNHHHAELIVKTFKKLYPIYGDNYCQLIDDKVKYANTLIAKFEEEDDFRIAVSVDMLDTGIDVPSVLNLVFFKPVRSKIKFVQMIGRGTRLCPKLIDGRDKKYFLIFDYCGNFEYFGEHPEGASNKNGKSLTQRLFDLRLDILVELQKYEHQSNPMHKAYYEELKPQLYNKVVNIKQNGSFKIAVREEMAYVDKFADYERWMSLSILESKEMQIHLSKLIDSDLNQPKGSLSFDYKMFMAELSVLANGSICDANRQVSQIRKISRILLDTATIPAVIEKSETLKTLLSVEFWENPSIDKLEQYRSEVRELMQFLPSNHETADIDGGDEIIDTPYTGEGFIDIRTYREKVIDYLAEHTDNATIRKIHNLEPIDSDDVKELERILWNELGTVEDYKKSTDIDNLAVFIRSIVGIEQVVINEKFGEFLIGNKLNSQQQEFVKQIIDYVRENGDIKAEDLIEKSPFDSADILTLFGSDIAIITGIIATMHNSVIAA